MPIVARDGSRFVSTVRTQFRNGGRGPRRVAGLCRRLSARRPRRLVGDQQFVQPAFLQRGFLVDQDCRSGNSTAARRERAGRGPQGRRRYLKRDASGRCRVDRRGMPEKRCCLEQDSRLSLKCGEVRSVSRRTGAISRRSSARPATARTLERRPGRRCLAPGGHAPW